MPSLPQPHAIQGSWPVLVPQAVCLKYWARITRGDLFGALVRGMTSAVRNHIAGLYVHGQPGL
jgi:hypothetical protein